MVWTTKNEIKKLKDVIEEEVEKEVNKKLETIDEPEVFLSQRVIDVCKTMCKQLPHLEWMAGLVGKKEGMIYKIEDLLLIEQEVDGSNVKATKQGQRVLHTTPNIMGWIHSHNTMSAFQSGTDEETSMNFPLSITTNNDLDFYGTSKEKISIFENVIEVVMDCEINYPAQEESAFDKEIKEKVKVLVKENNYVGYEDYKGYDEYNSRKFARDGSLGSIQSKLIKSDTEDDYDYDFDMDSLKEQYNRKGIHYGPL